VLSISCSAYFPSAGRPPANILENNIVQTTGSAGESIASASRHHAGPAHARVDIEVTRVMTFAVLGGLLGILMMIPCARRSSSNSRQADLPRERMR